MKASSITRRREQQGSSLLMTVLMLAIAGFAVGSMITAQTTYTRNCEGAYCVNKAAYLADAGIHAAVVRLNAASDGNICYSESRTYFDQTNSFSAADWGFQTQLGSSNGHNIVTSTGRYQGRQAQVSAEVSLGSGNRSLHALFAHALFAGNSSHDTNYNLTIGGTGTGADFVKGDTYAGQRITVSGTAKLRLPEVFVDTNHNSICDPGEAWTNAYATQTFTNPLSQTAYLAYSNSIRSHLGDTYNNSKYDYGEAFRDTIGNGQYDAGEPFTDLDGDGVWDAGDGFIDKNGNGTYNSGETVVDKGNGRYDTGEEWVEDSTRKISNKKVRVNGRWDDKGGYWKQNGNQWTWTTSSATTSWPAEQYEDVGDGVYSATEPYEDHNGVYDAGEAYIDDRNTVYDYGTQATGPITGLPSPGPGQRAANGGDAAIDPPDLEHMYYAVNKNDAMPVDALTRWGNDVDVKASDYGSAVAITDASRPEHIFVRNPPIGTSGSVSSGGKTIYKRSYTTVTNGTGQRVDDYFFEDPTDASYNSSVTADSIDGTSQTSPMYVNVRSEANVKLYYVDGNVYIHHPQVYSMRFRQPGTRITIVASGNITISDEFYYNAQYAKGLQPVDINSTIVNNPSDALCLIALNNPNCPGNSGNIYIGDAQFGTGGSIHAMLYAQNNFVVMLRVLETPTRAAWGVLVGLIWILGAVFYLRYRTGHWRNLRVVEPELEPSEDANTAPA